MTPNPYALAIGRRLQIPLKLVHAMSELLDPLTLDNVRDATKKVSEYKCELEMGNNALPMKSDLHHDFIFQTKLQIAAQFQYAENTAHSLFMKKALSYAYYAIDVLIDLFNKDALERNASELFDLVDCYLHQAMFWLSSEKG